MGNRNLLILYGSETGTAQDHACTLARNLQYQRFNPTISAMDDFDLKKLLDFQTLIIICATSGQGELPRNARLKFWKFLMKKKLPNDLLNHINFATFGLGDSSYPKYNFAIRKIHARLLQLGATEFCQRGESDEQAPEGPEAFYAAWEQVLMNTLNVKIPLPEGLKPIPDSQLLDPIFKLTINQNKFKKNTSNTKLNALERSSSTPLTKLRLSLLNRLTALSHDQEVLQLVLTDPSNSLKYSIGDVVALYPTNDEKDVNTFITLQGWQNIADFPLSLDFPSHLAPDGGFIKNLTLRSLITHHLDIMAVPPRSFFQAAHYFASDEREREKLKEFSKLEEAQQLYDYANRPRRSILEVTQEFFSLKIPIAYLLDVIPFIKPRLFSISCAPVPDSLELTVAIVEYQTIIRRIRRGLCTRWVKSLQLGDDIVVNVVNNNLKLPTGDMILVGPGTGIAPIKAVIESNNKDWESKGVGRNLLMFAGHRYKNKDYLYGDLWPKMKGLRVAECFSRQAGGYVQDGIWNEKVKVNNILVNGGGLYVCGSSGKMPTQVRITIEQVLTECNDNITEEQAKRQLLEFESEGKYIQETW